MALSVHLLAFLLVLGCVPASFGSENAHWTYNGQNDGPKHWKDNYPDCGKNRQSPIRFNETKQAEKPKFVFKDFDKDDFQLTVRNNGHSVLVTYENGGPSVMGGGVSGTYLVLQFHFHWGTDNTKGSEHAVGKNKYPMEIHIVSENKVGPDGETLAVLAIFAEVDDDTSQSGESGKGFDAIVEAVKLIKNGPDTVINVANGSFKLDDMLPNTDKFYRYLGSLTTPDCSETVVWTVFKETFKITTDQMHAFRELAEDQKELENNFRPIQETNDRVIYLATTD